MLKTSSVITKNSVNFDEKSSLLIIPFTDIVSGSSPLKSSVLFQISQEFVKTFLHLFTET